MNWQEYIFLLSACHIKSIPILVRNFSFLTLYCSFLHKSATVLVTTNYVQLLFYEDILKEEVLSFPMPQTTSQYLFQFSNGDFFCIFHLFQTPQENTHIILVVGLFGPFLTQNIHFNFFLKNFENSDSLCHTQEEGVGKTHRIFFFILHLLDKHSYVLKWLSSVLSPFCSRAAFIFSHLKIDESQLAPHCFCKSAVFYHL